MISGIAYAMKNISLLLLKCYFILNNFINNYCDAKEIQNILAFKQNDQRRLWTDEASSCDMFLSAFHCLELKYIVFLLWLLSK